MKGVLQTCLEAVDAEPTSYSGRGMYGRMCVSFSAESFAEAAKTLAHLGAEIQGSGHSVDDLPEAAMESLGRGVVVYWPYEEWVDG